MSSYRKKKLYTGSPKTSRKKNSPDSLCISRASSTLCETPDAVRNTRQSHLISPSSELSNQNKFHKKSTSSSENGFDSRRNSNNSENHFRRHHSSFQENVSSVDTTDSMFYVRLGNISEKGVFVSASVFHLTYFRGNFMKKLFFSFIVFINELKLHKFFLQIVGCMSLVVNALNSPPCWKMSFAHVF